MSRRTTPITLGAILLAAASPYSLQAQWSTDSLSAGRQQVAAVTADGLAFFAGGRDGTVFSDVIDIYDEASDTWSTATLSSPRTGVAAAAVGDYVLLAGGAVSFFESTATIDVYHVPSMTWSTPATLSEPKFNAAVTTVGTKVIIAGGSTGGALSLMPSAVVDIYDAALGPPDDLTAWSTATLSQARSAPVATTVGDQVIIAGGVIGPPPVFVATVDIYDDATETWSTATLSQARTNIAATTAGTRAYFAGGLLTPNPATMSDVVDIYDAQTGTWTTETLSAPRHLLSAVTLGDTVLFAGGATSTQVVDVVDVLDACTGAWEAPMQLDEARHDMGATTIGGKALFAGGYDGASASTLVDVYAPGPGPWTDLGNALAGSQGTPDLCGDGPLTDGTATTFRLTGALANASAWLILGLGVLDLPFKGGVMVPTLDILLGPLPTGPAGEIVFGFPWPAGLPSNASLYWQYWIADAGGPFGYAASNGLQSTTP